MTIPNPRLNTRAISSTLTLPSRWISPKMVGTCQVPRSITARSPSGSDRGTLPKPPR